MQKKVLALAVAAAISAPAFADTANVNVYGKVDVSYDSINTGKAVNGTQGITSNRVASNVTYLGFKGAEDLGNGLSAVWQIESTIMAGDAALNGTSTTRGFLGTRNTFLGLKNDSLGTVLAGRHDTPYKLSTRRLDQFGDNIADNRSLMGHGQVSAFDNRQDQVVAYISPSLGGLTIAAAHVNLAPAANTSTNAAGTPNAPGAAQNGSANSIAAWYDANGIYATVAFEQHSNLTSTGIGATSEKATKVGLGYTMDGVFSLGVAAEKTSDNLAVATTNVGGTLVGLGANQDGHKAAYVAGKVIVGNGAIKAAYTVLGNVKGTSNSGARQVAVGYDYSLSKRSTVYALYTKLKNGAAANYALSGEPTIGGASTLAGTGAAPRAIAVGMKFTF